MELALFNPVETNSNDGLLGLLALLALPGLATLPGFLPLLALPGLILLCVYCRRKRPGQGLLSA